MIEQQINLYQDRFREKLLLFSAAQVGVVLLCLVLAGGALSYWLNWQLGDARLGNQAIKSERDRATADLTVANAELAKLLQDNRVDQQIENVARQVSARKKVLAFVDSNRFGSGEGFSGYLEALSRLHMDGVWLSRVRLAEGFVLIEGSSLRAESVPDYFDRFGGEAVFKGNRFDLFQLNRARDTEWKVDFEIATREVVDE